MTPEIEKALTDAKILTEVEDIYRPYKPHRKTRASVAREKGLEPLSAIILEQKDAYEKSIEEIAEEQHFVKKIDFAYNLVREGTTSIQEVSRVLGGITSEETDN